MLLRPRMFADSNGLAPFGLVHRGIVPPASAVLPRAVWYNRLGQYLGDGGITKRHLARIALEISFEDLFIFVPPGPMTISQPDLGPTLVATRCVLVIGQMKVCAVEDGVATTLARVQFPHFTKIARPTAVDWIERGVAPQ